MKIPASITISRPQYGDLRQKINIQIRDEISRIAFVDAEIDLAEFAKALTGLSSCEMEMEVRGLQYVGMKTIRESRSIFCPLTTYKREELSEWLKENAQEEGWVVSTYLGSKGSVVSAEGGQTLNYSVTKYITP